MTGKGNFAGQNAFSARRSSTAESLPPENSSTALPGLGGHLPEDVDRLRLEGAEVGGGVVRGAL